VSATKDANFTLSNTALTSSDGMSLMLSGIGTANLTGGASANTFNVSSWTGTANLDGAAGDDVFNVTTSASGTVNVTGGAHTVGETVNVTGGAAADTFTLTSSVAGITYNLDGAGGTNTVVVNANGNYTLSNSSLSTTAAGFNSAFGLSNITVANLTGGASANTFTVS